MPLPTAPTPPSRPKRRRVAPESVEDLEMPSLGEVEEPTRPAKKRRARQAPANERPAPKRRPRAPKGDLLDRREAQDESVPDGWIKDRKTGVLHKYIPKTEMDEDNMPVLHLDDLDLDDLTGEAEKYLAHLRVPPDREEQKRLKEDRENRRRAQNAAYSKANPEEEDADG